MPARARNLTPPETYSIDQLPEFLRSSGVGNLVAVALEQTAAMMAEGTERDLVLLAPLADQLRVASEEIRSWHSPKPRPAELNGGA